MDHTYSSRILNTYSILPTVYNQGLQGMASDACNHLSHPCKSGGLAGRSLANFPYEHNAENLAARHSPLT